MGNEEGDGIEMNQVNVIAKTIDNFVSNYKIAINYKERKNTDGYVKEFLDRITIPEKEQKRYYTAYLIGTNRSPAEQIKY